DESLICVCSGTLQGHLLECQMEVLLVKKNFGGVTSELGGLAATAMCRGLGPSFLCFRMQLLRITSKLGDGRL
ncbi:unnamed protein product, partial [Urochloa humidicola]